MSTSKKARKPPIKKVGLQMTKQLEKEHWPSRRKGQQHKQQKEEAAAEDLQETSTWEAASKRSRDTRKEKEERHEIKATRKEEEKSDKTKVWGLRVRKFAACPELFSRCFSPQNTPPTTLEHGVR